jgi:hypothetical protein
LIGIVILKSNIDMNEEILKKFIQKNGIKIDKNNNLEMNRLEKESFEYINYTVNDNEEFRKLFDDKNSLYDKNRLKKNPFDEFVKEKQKQKKNPFEDDEEGEGEGKNYKIN